LAISEKKSGWVTALTEAEVASFGSAESFLTGSNITKKRQVHQMTASSIHVFEILKRAFRRTVLTIE
jgi:hypothetical protein